jgi:hypothetical protein
MFGTSFGFVLPRDFCPYGVARIFASFAFYHFIALKYRIIFAGFRFFLHPRGAAGSSGLRMPCKNAENRPFSAVFLASRSKIYDNKKLEGLPSCWKSGWGFL